MNFKLNILILVWSQAICISLALKSEFIEPEKVVSGNGEESLIMSEEASISKNAEGNVVEEIVEETHVEASWNPPAFSLKKSDGIRPGKVVKAVTLSKPFKKAIVSTHNKLRSIAKPKAANMRKMTWDNELAKLATQYTRRCIYEHNPNPVHSRFSFVGENLFISIGMPFKKSLLSYAVKAWDGEKSLYDYETRKCVPGKICGHYTQVVWADTFKVGCGVTVCTNINVRGKIWRNAVLFGCNYGPGGNYPTHPFISGPTCSKCDPTDKCKQGLCTNSIRDRSKLLAKDIKWTPWSAWTPCNRKCGIGSQKRQRKCSTFVPSDCKGYGSEVKFCFKRPCTSQGGTFTYNIVLNEGDNLLKNSLQQALSGSKRTLIKAFGPQRRP